MSIQKILCKVPRILWGLVALALIFWDAVIGGSSCCRVALCVRTPRPGFQGPHGAFFTPPFFSLGAVAGPQIRFPHAFGFLLDPHSP